MKRIIFCILRRSLYIYTQEKHIAFLPAHLHSIYNTLQRVETLQSIDACQLLTYWERVLYNLCSTVRGSPFSFYYMKSKIFSIVCNNHTFYQVPFGLSILWSFDIESTEDRILLNESEYNEIKEASASLWIEIEEETHYKDWSFYIKDNRLYERV